MHGLMRAGADAALWKTHLPPRRAAVAMAAHNTIVSTIAATA